ncbi:cardiolipin synthase ClsB [Diaphorobacter aerolatus]|uniref:Cardiolipin synthase B n=1 Tax=Diaphorobacter aerolatus TaxID=1288495 RepID=A0A7H0GQN7_9BURK|nr:cardiolipin synthase ClsB [Diaphorobacter aerolatus]
MVFHSGHEVRLLQGTQEFFPALIADMNAATRSIQFETYIFDCTASGEQIAEAFINAARRGVDVRVAVDGFGTGLIPAPLRERFEAAGVQLQVFSAVRQFALLLPRHWRRLHRKLCVIDDEVMYCGGINVLDDFWDPNHGKLEAPRFDFAVRAKGALVDQASDNMDKLWWRMRAVHDASKRKISRAVADLRAARVAQSAAKRSAAKAKGMRAALLFRDNLRNRSRIEKAYLRAIGSAREEVIIANAYFMPGRKLRRALILAAERGVRVQLLLQGRYEYFMQFHASRPVYGALLKAGVQIFEYSPSFLHAKVAVVDAYGDRPWATVGSSNLEPLSLLLAREANVVVEDAAFAQDLQQRLKEAMEHAGRQMDPDVFARRPLRERVLDHVAAAIMRSLIWVTGNRY